MNVDTLDRGGRSAGLRLRHRCRIRWRTDSPTARSPARHWPRSRRCVCRPADKAAPAPTSVGGWSRRLLQTKNHYKTSEGPAEGSVLLVCGLQ